MDNMPMASLLFFCAYFLGSLSSAIIVCRIFDLPDPRTKGSKNPGATNVLRLAGKREASYVLIGDMLKGAIPVVIANLIGLSSIAMAMIGLSAIFGHMFPIYYRFKGGKGVATALGVFFGFQFMMGVIACAIWLVVLRLFSYSSLSSLVTIIIAPFLSIYMLNNAGAFLPLCIVMLLVIIKHNQNISRLIEGEEPKTHFSIKESIEEKDASATESETDSGSEASGGPHKDR